uniref:Rapid alkalinization factor 2 n=1 Tax=Solanum tuberosum TaxID=4113 RepID=M1C3C3_SOLTU
MAKVKSLSIMFISSIFFIVIVALSSPAVAGSAAAVAASGSHQLGYFPMTLSSFSPICDGSIGDCLAEEDEDEFGMESESSRRMLAYRRRYISYVTECRVQGEELHTTIAVPELRRTLTNVDAVPSRAAVIENPLHSKFLDLLYFTFFLPEW